MLDKKKKQSLIKKYAAHDDDTGSPQVQIAILTEEIKELTAHLKSHKKDFSSRRGLFRKVNLRRKLLEYLAANETAEYESLIKKLKIKRKTNLAEMPKDELSDKETSADKEEDDQATAETDN